MKKKLLLVLLLIVGLVTLTGCGKSKTDSDITSFRFSFGGFWGQTEYNLYKEGDKVHYTASGYNGVDLNIDKKIDTSYLDKLKKVVDDKDLQDWDGYDERNDDVLDGDGFYLEIIYEDGTTVKASGSNKFPDDYDKVKEALQNFFNEIK